MNIFEAIILGLIQGLTEFLPISSTGHLTLAGRLMNLISETNPEHWTAFIAVIQMGTLVAVIYYFWKDLWNITNDFLRDNLFKRKSFSSQSENSRLGWYIIIGSVPVGIIGLLFKDFIEGAFTKNLQVISFSLIILGLLLALAEKTGSFKKEITGIRWLDAFLIGCAQAVSLIPGSSRSGTTITAGLFLGYKREAIARFSFLLSIPAVMASGLLEFYHSLEYIDADMAVNLAVATIASAVSGYMAIDFLLKYLKRNSSFIFVYYRVILGAVLLLLIYMGILRP